jgi:hypothetical protein
MIASKHDNEIFVGGLFHTATAPGVTKHALQDKKPIALNQN